MQWTLILRIENHLDDETGDIVFGKAGQLKGVGRCDLRGSEPHQPPDLLFTGANWQDLHRIATDLGATQIRLDSTNSVRPQS